ncbi:uncharacterized protein LOC111332434 isoform X1 [Stylophora pistillata]|uniref:uncharacterized protein LOC111332434 isoform X1 n=1 Tax=Stylophora pistillata TaxID=50429 RepID=UPI000C03952A|nr:uncharacterized protein LOC111332434 isoform X1 [Stylophora pistillata]
MQTSESNFPLIPQQPLAQHQQCSPGIDQLIQRAELENSEQVRLIETEKQRYAALLKQFEEKNHKIEELEKSTTQLDEEAKQLHKQFAQNREICASLKRTNCVLQEHEEAMEKKKETVVGKLEKARSKNQSILNRYKAIWDRYKRQYESKENAQELTKIKINTKETKEELQTIRSTIQQMEEDISIMEKEKTTIEESLKKGITSAIPLMIQLAQLNIERRKTEDCIERITTKIANIKQAEFKKCVDESHQENNSPDGNTSLPQTPVTISQQVEHSDFDQSSKQESIVSNMEVESYEDQNVLCQPKEAVPMKKYSPEHLSVTPNQQRRHCTDDQTSSAYEESYTDQHLQSLAKTNKTTSTTLHGDEEQTVFPTTPTSTDQQNCGSISTPEVVKSPFNFEVHTDMIQQLTKSPGDGFFFQSRPMFNHGSVDGENNQPSADSTPFLFNMQETSNTSGSIGSASKFNLDRPAANLFEPSVTTESRSSMGLFGTNLSPVASGCSIFGDADFTHQSKSPEGFTFSFGTTTQPGNAKSPNRPAFALF